MALTVKKTTAKCGPGFNVRTEFFGDEDHDGVDFRLTGVMLDKDSTNELADDSTLYDRLFKKGSKPLEPALRKFAPLDYLGKFENATVTIWIPEMNGDQLRLSECKLRRIVLEGQTGGFVELSLQVQCAPDVKQLGQLYKAKNQDIEVSIRFGREEKPKTKDQPELPLDHKAEGEDKAKATDSDAAA